MSDGAALRQNEPDLLSVIDIGSSKTSVLCGHSRADGTLTFAGHGRLDSRGVRKGVVADIKACSEQVKRAVEVAEKAAGHEIARAVVSIGGPHIKGVNSRGGLTLGNRQREIHREDIRSALDRARSIQIPADRTVVHLLPREFIIDEQPGIQDPLGMTGCRLEVDLHLVTASASAVQSIVSAVNLAGVSVDDHVFEGVAAAESLANFGEGERVIGACVLDIGAGSTEIACYYDGAVVFTATVAIGGEHFTNDAAVGMKCAVAEAERLKCLYASAVVTTIPSDAVIEIVDENSVKTVSQRYLAEIIEPRARELFELVRDTLRAGGVLDLIGSGVFITGGLARMPGLDEVCRQVLRTRVHCEAALPLTRMPYELAVPEMSCAVGLLAYAHRTRNMKRNEPHGIKGKLMQMLAGA